MLQAFRPLFRPLTIPQVTVDIVAALAFFGTTGLLAVISPSSVGLAAVACVTFVMAGAVAIRRLSPTLALAVAWGGAILQMLLGLNPLSSNLAIFAVLYVTAAYGTRLVFWLGFGSAIVGAVVITLYLFFATTFLTVEARLSGLPIAGVTLVAATFALMLAWTAGALVRMAERARENRAAQRRAEAEAIAEQERVRIARDMHDVVAHSLAVVIAQADGARYAAASSSTPSDVAAEALSTISTTARSALADVRLLLTQLRYSQADGPQPTLADLEGLYEQVRAAGVALEVEADRVPGADAPAAIQLAVYRILQEALTNAMRHGDGGRVSVRLVWDERHVELDVRNRMPPDPPAQRSGHGLIGMGERAHLVGGRLNAADDDGEFIVSATLPIGGASA